MPSWKDLKRFCENDGWELYKDTDHYYFRKWMNDGELKLTKVSKGTGEIGKALFRWILKDQLQVTLEFFNKNQ